MGTEDRIGPGTTSKIPRRWSCFSEPGAPPHVAPGPALTRSPEGEFLIASIITDEAARRDAIFILPENNDGDEEPNAFYWLAPTKLAQLGGRAFPKLIYYKKHDKGGQFAAWEQP